MKKTRKHPGSDKPSRRLFMPSSDNALTLQRLGEIALWLRWGNAPYTVTPGHGEAEERGTGSRPGTFAKN